MTSFLKGLPRIAAGVLLKLACVQTFAADNVSTFASFYHQGAEVSWLWGGLAALVVGALAFIGWPIIGPVLAPVITTIGTSIGGLMGLSGIAATNAGLALLGGGAIASGGFGVVGGTALLAAALTFSADITLDYALGSVTSKYESGKFAEASLKMMTLPLPLNTSGPDSVQAAGKALETPGTKNAWNCVRQYPESVDELRQCIASKQKPQRQMVQEALAIMDKNRKPLSGADAERDDAMYALLYFLNNNYIAAKRYALKAYKQGAKSKSKPSLPAYVYSVSLLYDPVPNLNEINAKFQFALDAEPNNPLTPVMYSAMLDRLSYRLNDGAVGVGMLDQLGKSSNSLPADARKLAIQQTLLSHNLMQLKLAQQRILSLTRTQNQTILDNPHTLRVVQNSLMDYRLLLVSGKTLVTRQEHLITKLQQDKPWWDSVKDGNNPFKNVKEMLEKQGWPESVRQFKGALAAYQGAQKELEVRVSSFEREREKGKREPDTSIRNSIWEDIPEAQNNPRETPEYRQ